MAKPAADRHPAAARGVCKAGARLQAHPPSGVLCLRRHSSRLVAPEEFDSVSESMSIDLVPRRP
jgi:hypothetical protein